MPKQTIPPDLQSQKLVLDSLILEYKNTFERSDKLDNKVYIVITFCGFVFVFITNLFGGLTGLVMPEGTLALLLTVLYVGSCLAVMLAYVLVGKVADIVNNPYGVSWQNLVDSQRIMDITLNEFNTHPTAFICTNIQETDLAGHAEDVARYAERLQVVDRNLARLVEAMQPDDCLVVMADHGNDPTIGHSHHTREVVPVLVYQQGMIATQLGVRTTLSDVGATVCEFFRAPPPQNGRSFLSSLRFAGDTL